MSDASTMIAVLIDKYHLTINQIAGLTDRQIYDIYFHVRDKDGSIRVTEPEPVADAEVSTYEHELQKLTQLKFMLKMSNDKFEQLREKLKQKFEV